MWVRMFERLEEHPAFHWPKFLFRKEDQKSPYQSKPSRRVSMFEQESFENFSEQMLDLLRQVYQNTKTMEMGKSQFDGLVETIKIYSPPIAASIQYYAKKRLLLFSSFCSLIHSLTAPLDDIDRSKFVFSLYAKQRKNLREKRWQLMNKNFKFPDNFRVAVEQLFQSKNGEAITETQFCDIQVRFFYSWRQYFKSLKYILYTDLGLRPQTVNTEYEAVMSTMEGIDLDQYLKENIDKIQNFMLIPKKFWDSWTACGKADKITNRVYDSFKSHRVKAFSLKKTITGSMLRQKMKYGVDYYLIPEKPWLMIKSWYYNPESLRRPVLKHQAHPQRNVVIQKNGFFYQVEVDAPVLKYDKMLEDGTIPTKSGKKKDFHFHSRYAGREKFLGGAFGPLEVVISRLQTLDNLRKGLADMMDVDFANSRLWINKRLIEVEEGEKTVENLMNAEDMSNSVFYIQEKQKAGSWPSESLKHMQSQDNRRADLVHKTRGLVNLGNTCYMNSALQCIFATPFVQKYLLGEVMNFAKQINKENKLAYQGFLVKAFARLLDMVVAPSQSHHSGVPPRQFKKIMSACNQQFYGFHQQDSQEFLVFLIDGLHEEVNLRQRPGYVENPESEGRDLLDLSLEFYSNHLRRNWSFFQFLFNGQFKNEIRCAECDKTSLTFEPFNHLSLPIEDKAMCRVKVQLFKLPAQTKNIIAGRVSQELLEQMNDDENQSLITELIDSVRGEPHSRDSSHFHFKQEVKQSTSMLRHQRTTKELLHAELDDPSPIELSFLLPRQSMGIDIIKEIEKIEDLDINVQRTRPPHVKFSNYTETLYNQLPAFQGPNNTARYKTFTDLVLYVAVGYSRPVVLGNLNSLTQLLNVEEITIFAYEVVTPLGREFIHKWYHENEAYISHMPDAPFKLPDRTKMSISGSKRKQPSQPRQELAKRSSMNLESPNPEQPEKQAVTYTSYFNEYSRFLIPHVSQELQFCNWVLSIAHNRTYQTIHDQVFASRIDFKLETIPVFFLLNRDITGYELYEEVYARIQGRLKPESKYRKRENLWWTNEFRSLDARSHNTSIQQSIHVMQEDKIEDDDVKAQNLSSSSSDGEKEAGPLKSGRLAVPSSGPGPRSPVVQNLDTPRLDQEQDEQSPQKKEKSQDTKVTEDDKKGQQNPEVVQEEDQSPKCETPEGVFSSNAKKIETEVLTHRPFLLRLYNYERNLCGICKKVSCRGCIVKPDFSLNQFDIQHAFNMFIDWSASTFQHHLIEFGVCSHPTNQKKSSEQQEKDQKHVSDLSDCFKRLTEKQVIEGKDAVYCSKCKDHTKHQKILSLFRLPPILILHFKRFRFVNQYHRSKISTVVNFPLYGLNMQDFMDPQVLGPGNDIVGGQEILNNHKEDYDLYAVINHYGNLNSGHYTACIADGDGNWNYYDDSEVRRMPDSEEVRSQFAYMLFYKRRGIENKTLRQVFPSLSNIFIGKPVAFKGKKAFVKQKLADKNQTAPVEKTDQLLSSIQQDQPGELQHTLDLENNSPTISRAKVPSENQASSGVSEMSNTTTSKITVRINETGQKGAETLQLNQDIELAMLDVEKDVDYINESEDDIFKRSSKEEEAKLKQFLLEQEEKMHDRKVKPAQTGGRTKKLCSSLCYFKGVRSGLGTNVAYENRFN